MILPTLEFGTGLITDFNAIRSHEYPAVWMTINPVSGTNSAYGAPLDVWEIELIIAQKDRMDSSPEEYEHIIDDCDEIAQKLMYNYNRLAAGYKMVSLSDRNREPFVKKYADCLSGVVLSFKMTIPDQTNIC